MTYTSSASKSKYAGNGVATQFPTGFKFLKSSQVKVLLVTVSGPVPLIENTDYTVAGAGAVSGTVTYPKAGSARQVLAAGETLTIYLAPQIAQETKISNTSTLWLEEVEVALDLLTMICLSLQEETGRSVKVAIQDTTDPAALIAQLRTDAANATTSASTAATKANEASASAAAAAAAAASVPSAGTVLLKASNLSDLADVAAARTSLGLKSAALLESTVLAQLAVVGAYTRQQYAVPVVLTAQNGAIALDADLHQDIDISATGAITLGAPANAVRGKTIFMTLYAASALAITWNAAFKPNADNALDATFAVGKRIFLNFRCVDGANWLLMGRVKEA